MMLRQKVYDEDIFGLIHRRLKAVIVLNSKLVDIFFTFFIFISSKCFTIKIVAYILGSSSLSLFSLFIKESRLII